MFRMRGVRREGKGVRAGCGQWGRRGAALIEALVLTTLIAFLASLAAKMLFSRSQLFGETHQRGHAQRAVEAAHSALTSCLESTWDGSGSLSAAVTACQPPAITMGNRTYTFDVTVTDSAPYKIDIHAVASE